MVSGSCAAMEGDTGVAIVAAAAAASTLRRPMANRLGFTRRGGTALVQAMASVSDAMNKGLVRVAVRRRARRGRGARRPQTREICGLGVLTLASANRKTQLVGPIPNCPYGMEYLCNCAEHSQEAGSRDLDDTSSNLASARVGFRCNAQSSCSSPRSWCALASRPAR